MSDTPQYAGSARQRIVTDPDGIQSMHDILSSWERRALLYYLQERNDPADLEDVAAHLAGWRRGDETPATDETDVVELRRELVCEHVEKMDAFGVISFDAHAESLRLVDGMTVAVSPPWQSRDTSFGP